ncbi:MAG: glycosyltransferase family 4 protein [Flavobacteriales bacterium]|nr:glycosyltransferase family 4 protein [Flavobacteriales bacterium]
MKKLLIIGKVWPEPNSSAAGWRMLDLIKAFTAGGYIVHFACTANKTGNETKLEKYQVVSHTIILNDDSFDHFISTLEPDVVMYDRFMTEEQFGWRVRRSCEKAVTLLDTEDLHFLRKGREEGVKRRGFFKQEDLYNDWTKREIASMLRCDLNIIISKYEVNLLISEFGFKPGQLFYLPLSKSISREIVPWDERHGVVFIGNFLHEPNWDAVLQLKRIWKDWTGKSFEAGIKVYGAYPPQKAYGLNSDKDKFYVMGRADDADKVIRNAKLLVAPLRFGAGLKGKIIEAMANGTPFLTTSIGVEGLPVDAEGSGAVCDQNADWAQRILRFLDDKSYWHEQQDKGFETLGRLNDEYQLDRLVERVVEISANLPNIRIKNFLGEILHYHTLRSTEYLSKWIMAKNQNMSVD